jgi:hypothetical protein
MVYCNEADSVISSKFIVSKQRYKTLQLCYPLTKLEKFIIQ